MNPLFFLFGLLGAAFAGSGAGSDSSTTTAAAATPVSDDPGLPTGDGAMSDGGMDMPMQSGDEDHAGHDMDDMAGPYIDITAFGSFHGSSSHTDHMSLAGGRTPITTEAMEMYNALRDFLGLDPVDMETVGEWAFDNRLTNNDVPYGDDLSGVGLFYGMQGAKAGWISDDAFDPQMLADIQRLARQDEVDQVMELVGAHGHAGFKAFLESEGLVETFVNTLKMEPHYGGWMHGRTHGWLEFNDADGEQIAIAHDLNHLTVLSHDQKQPFMNDTFDWPQWPALDMPEANVINYFQSMVTLGDPQGDGIELVAEAAPTPEDVVMIMLVSEGAMFESNPVTLDDDDEEISLF